MVISIISMGKKMPIWVQAGVADYLKRLPAMLNVTLLEISGSKGAKMDRSKRMMLEGKLLLSHIPAKAWVVVLDEKGQQWSTQQVANELDRWVAEHQNVALVIGGADGLPAEVRARANQVWSLSLMTMPHMLVRVVLAEQLYRAWTLLNHHPYHREG